MHPNRIPNRNLKRNPHRKNDDVPIQKKALFRATYDSKCFDDGILSKNEITYPLRLFTGAKMHFFDVSCTLGMRIRCR